MAASWSKRLPAVVVAIGLSASGCADDGGSSGQRLDEVVPPAATAPVEATTTEVGEDAGGDDREPVEQGSTVDITVVDVAGYAGGDLAGVVMREADGLVVGGFAAVIGDDPFTTTQTVRLPAAPGVVTGPWPHLTDEEAILAPGGYVLTLWVDAGLGGYTRWFPANTDARGLAGCVERFRVGDDTTTEIVVAGDVRSTGYFGVCGSGADADEPSLLPAGVEIVEPDRRPATPPFADLPAGDVDGMIQELLVWQGDFLAVGQVFESQPLPEQLPPEIAERFPPEIQDLFPDGLPPTLDEAIAVIEDAGMMSEVQDAVSSIPGAYEAIFTLDSPAPTWLFARSADGLEWERLDVVLPEDVAVILDVAAFADELVVIGHRPTSGPTFAITDVSAAWTGDLESWTAARLAPERPADLPEGANLVFWEASVEANARGWIVTALVAADLGETDPPSEPSPELAPYLVPGGWGPATVATRWFSPWLGVPVVTDPVGAPTTEPGVIVATNTGFIHLSDRVRHTSDGTTWVARARRAPAVNPWTTFSQPLPDGFVLYVDGFEADPAVYRVDDSGELWMPLNVTGLPSTLGPAQVTDGNGYVLETYDWSGGLELWIVATPDGERWFLEQYHFVDVESDGPEYRPRVAALRNGTLLVGGAFLDDDDWWLLTF